MLKEGKRAINKAMTYSDCSLVMEKASWTFPQHINPDDIFNILYNCYIKRTSKSLLTCTKGFV